MTNDLGESRRELCLEFGAEEFRTAEYGRILKSWRNRGILYVVVKGQLSSAAAYMGIPDGSPLAGTIEKSEEIRQKLGLSETFEGTLLPDGYFWTFVGRGVFRPAASGAK